MPRLARAGGRIAVAVAALAAAAPAGAATGNISTAAGTGSPGFSGDAVGPPTNAQLSSPVSVSRSPHGSGFLIGDLGNRRVRVVVPEDLIYTAAGNGAAGSGGDNGDSQAAQLNGTLFSATALHDQTFLIADTFNGRVRKVAAGYVNGTITTLAGTGGTGHSGDDGAATAAQVGRPQGIAVKPDGSYLFADALNHRVRHVLADGTIKTVAGTGTAGSAGDGGAATDAQLDTPQGIAITPWGGFLIAEKGRVRRVSPAGKIKTVAGAGTLGFSGDNGPATSAQIGTPTAIDAADDGSFVIADGDNNRVRRVAPDGTISTIAGTGTAGYDGEGTATAKQLNHPKGVAYDGQGDVLIADTDNHRVRRVDSGDPPTPPAAAFTLTQTGWQPEPAVDREGTTHLVWDISRSSTTGTDPNQDDLIGYCRIAKGATACDNGSLKSFSTAPCHKRDGDSAHHPDTDRPHVMITAFGEVVVLTHARCPDDTDVPTPNRFDDKDWWVAFSSTDDGENFGGMQKLSLSARPPTQPSNPDDRDFEDLTTEAVLDSADERIVIAESNNLGGIHVHGTAADGSTPAATRATFDADEGNTPAIVQRAKNSFVVAWADGSNLHTRMFNCPDCPVDAINNAANWTAGSQTIQFGARPKLVSGPGGTFLIHTSQQTPYRWYMRRITGTTVGPATLPAQPITPGASADAFQDSATGRLGFLYTDKPPGGFALDRLMYKHAREPTEWSTGGVFAEFPFDMIQPQISGATGDDGFTGMAAWFDSLESGFNPPISLRPLPASPADPPADPDAGDGDPPPGGGGDPPPGGGDPGPAPGGGDPGPAPGGGDPGPAPGGEEGPGICQILQFGAVDVVADACLTRRGDTYIAKGSLKINGLGVTLLSKSAEIRFTPKERRIRSTGPIRLALGDITMFKGEIDWQLPKGNTVDLPSLDVSKDAGKLFGFPLTGTIKPKLIRGAVEVPINVGLPKLFGGVSGSTTVKADNAAGVRLRAISVKVGNAPLGPLQVRNLSFSYDADADTWNGAATLVLIPQPPGPALESQIGFRGGDLQYLRNELTLPGNGIPLEPFNVVYLKKIRFSLDTGPPLKLSGGVTLTAGPTIAGVQAIAVDGDLSFTFPNPPQPAILRADGVVKVVSIPLATSFLEFRTNGYVGYGGRLTYKYAGFGVSSGIEGWLYKSDFNVEASAELCLGDLGCAEGRLVVSSVGIAGCVGSGFFSFGAGWKWDETPDLMFTSCDVGPVPGGGRRAVGW